ncbi:MAG: diguanylate cyclase [Pseudomonas sp.]|nr:diguanylate cyclase [Pseudomonas sp.]
MPGATTRSAGIPHAMAERLAVMFIALVITAIVALGVWQGWASYWRHIHEGETGTANLTRSAAQHADDAVKELDAFSASMVERVEWYGLNNLDKERLRKLFKAQGSIMRQIHGVFVYDRDGNWLVTDKDNLPANANNADREYFAYHRENPGDRATHIGPVVKSRTTGDLVIPLSRRLDNPDGSFAGVLLVTLYLDYFNRFYAGFKIDEQGIFVVALSNGTILTRRPFEEKVVGTSLANGTVYTQYLPRAPSGTVHITSIVDNVERINSYQLLEHYPLLIQTGMSRRDILRPWLAEIYRIATLLGVLILAVTGFGIALVRQIRSSAVIDTELRQAHVALEKMVMEDGLTGLANRRHLDIVLPLEISRARRLNVPLGVLMIDIDHFKRYNDLYGHLEGDGCIRAVAQVIKHAVGRSGDVAARYGGEEFTVVLPGTDELGTFRVAQAIAEGVRALGVRHDGNEPGVVTVSIGAHTQLPKALELAPESLIKAADEALYLAKQNGRDRIHPDLCII